MEQSFGVNIQNIMRPYESSTFTTVSIPKSKIRHEGFGHCL